jgi:hypothetical protein
LFGAVVGVFVVVFRDQVLPQRFFYDGIRIQQIAIGSGSSFGDKSYGTVGWIYGALGLGQTTTIAALLGFFLYLAVVAASLRLGGHLNQGVGTAAIIFGFTVLGAVYLGFYSKDVFVLPIVLTVLLAPKGARGEVLLAAAVISYALIFREYWLLTLTIYAVFRLFPGWVRGVPRALVASSIAVVTVGLVLYFAMGVDPDHFRTMANEGRVGGEDAQSAIRPFITISQPLGGLVNLVLTFFALLVPVPLAMSGGAYYLVLFAGISSLWIIYLRGVSRLSRGLVLHARLDTIASRSVAMILAFVCVQAAFEPDYGSALRHLTPLLPLMLIVLRAGAQAKPQLFGPHLSPAGLPNQRPTPPHDSATPPKPR